MRVLSRAWQILLKGIAEVQTAPRPLPAAEMVLVRLAYAADLPTPDEAIRQLREGMVPAGGSGPAPATGGGGGGGPRGGPTLAAANAMPTAAPRPARDSQPTVALSTFEDAVRLAETNRDVGLKFAMERHVRIVRFEDGRIEFNPVPGANAGLAGEMGRKLSAWTGRRWIVAVSGEVGQPTLAETREAKRSRLVDDARADPTVAAILARFPGAEIVDVQFPEEAAPVSAAGGFDADDGIDGLGLDPLPDVDDFDD